MSQPVPIPWEASGESALFLLPHFTYTIVNINTRKNQHSIKKEQNSNRTDTLCKEKQVFFTDIN